MEQVMKEDMSSEEAEFYRKWDKGYAKRDKYIVKAINFLFKFASFRYRVMIDQAIKEGLRSLSMYRQGLEGLKKNESKETEDFSFVSSKGEMAPKSEH